MAASENEFTEKLNNPDFQAVLVCNCFRSKELYEKLIKFKVPLLKLPHIICSPKLNSDFIVKGAKEGFENFVSCNKESNEIEVAILICLEKIYLKDLIKILILDANKHTPYLEEFVKVVVNSLPNKPEKKFVSDQLNISERWLQTIIRDCFDFTYKDLMRLLWVSCIATFSSISFSSLTIPEIAECYGYNDVKSLSRDFIKIEEKPASFVLSMTE
jgi:AraC-like DNA-binding protein